MRSMWNFTASDTTGTPPKPESVSEW